MSSIRRGGRVRSEADGPESLSVPSVSGPSRWSDPATQPPRLQKSVGQEALVRGANHDYHFLEMGFNFCINDSL